MSGKLYTYPNNFRAHKIQIAAQYSGFELELPEFVAGETNKSQEFLKKFPLGKVPAFENGNVSLFEPNAIAFYVGNDATRGGENEVEVLQWLGVADNDILPAACNWVYPTLGILQYNKQATEKAKEDLKKVLGCMNNYLSTRTFLVGERISQADISVACTMVMLYQHVMDAQFRAPFGNVNRWFNTLINQKEFKAVLGEVKLCEKMAQFDAKKYNEISGKGGKKEAAPKKPQQEKKKKAEKPAGDAKGSGDPQPAAAEAAPAKSKDPWCDCPEATMDMDAWKRCFSNEKDPEAMLKYFHEHFPKDNYSIWYGKYMYSDELALDFLGNNLIKGMFQRLEKLRKHAFGTVLLLGDTGGEFEIHGLWFWRGHDLAFKLSPDWQIDYETYEWEKLDYDCDKTKQMIRDYFIGEGEMYGKVINNQVVYK